MERLVNTYKRFVESNGLIVKPFLKELRKWSDKTEAIRVIKEHLEQAELSEEMLDIEIAKEYFHSYVKGMPDFKSRFGREPEDIFTGTSTA